MVKGAAYIMLFYLLGEIVSLLIGKMVPGSVCGMVLLFFALTTKIIDPKSVKSSCKGLTKNMAIFFVPAGVGIVATYGLICNNLMAFVTIIPLSTILVIIVVGHTHQLLERWNTKRAKRANSNNYSE